MHRCRRTPSRCISLGFTLVELLVVIAIIALLISMLLPSLASAREQAKKLKCLANQKDLASAMGGYSIEDAGENLIPIHWRGLDYNDAPTIPYGRTFVGPNEWGGRGGNPAMVTSLQHRYQFTQQWDLGPGDRPLNHYLFKNLQNAVGDTLDDRVGSDARLDLPVFQCPSDQGWPGGQVGLGMTRLASQPFGWDPEARHYDLMGNSYRIHCLWADAGGIARGEGFSSSVIYTLAPYMRPSSQIPSTARTVLISEGNAYLTDLWNRPEHASSVNEMGLGSGVTVADFWATGWHGEFQTYLAAFADGHAGIMQQDLVDDVVVQFPPNPNDSATEFSRGPKKQVGSRPEWIVTPTANANAYGNAMARGEGWQLDCLPAPPVITMFPGNY